MLGFQLQLLKKNGQANVHLESMWEVLRTVSHLFQPIEFSLKTKKVSYSYQYTYLSSILAQGYLHNMFLNQSQLQLVQLVQLLDLQLATWILNGYL